ncbi:MAG: tyrosine-type recombinase/integrase [Clostridiaceae bacterium]|jgi:site-specific recombinase XerD|nr:tyrosine-type recombinase/integrase [Clostridiaceae bacterium]
MAKDYFKERDKENLEKIRQIRKELPSFCNTFFIGIEPSTTVLTRLNYARDLQVFFRFLSENIFKKYVSDDYVISDLDKIKSTDLEMFADFLTSYEGAGGENRMNSPKGKARKLSAIRTFYNYFYKHDLINTNPAVKITFPKLREKEIIRLESDEVEQLLETADLGENMTLQEANFHLHTRMRDVAILTLLLGTGIRVSECVGLNIDDIDFKINAFTVTRKGGGRVILYFSDEVKAALTDWLAARADIEDVPSDESALFLSLQKRRISVRAVQLLVKKYSQKVTTVKNITPHKLRSTYGTSLYRATHDIYVVAEVLGHKDINTTKKHYAAMSEDIRRAAADKVKLKDDGNDDT